ncbi:hypothetical protein [Frateuria sp. STR12]|uniref:hypothetical protein n=1 Tax=Frateuria hangzhouensis TaxID=2995589 RepID=UPI0022608D90|nr:hypothetical protein [Frateuria sp. STR12]MCX7515046.1 hypothetical protein [Frateuria sp. STR12]
MHIAKLTLPLDPTPIAGKAFVHKGSRAMSAIAAIRVPAPAAIDVRQTAWLGCMGGRSSPAARGYPASHHASHRQENVHALMRINRRH